MAELTEKGAGSAAAMPIPVLYRRPELLTPGGYAGKSLVKSPAMKFAVETNSVPLNGVEFAAATRHYPIVFSAEATPFPMALLGLRNAENLFIGAENRWEAGTYIPAYVRRYPFVFMTGPDQKQFALCIDAASDLVVDGDENAFFRDGKPASATNDALAFCSSFQVEYEKTKAFSAALVEHGLFESKTADIDLQNGQKLVFGQFNAISEAKLNALPNAVIADWQRKGWLLWIHAHLLSFANWPHLAERAKNRIQTAGGTR